MKKEMAAEQAKLIAEQAALALMPEATVAAPTETEPMMKFAEAA